MFNVGASKIEKAMISVIQLERRRVCFECSAMRNQVRLKADEGLGSRVYEDRDDQSANERCCSHPAYCKEREMDLLKL